tara:strand:+ start:3043 stop:3213 length:171 start_codon:yes stop_codon:yes gene_type:complete
MNINWNIVHPALAIKSTYNHHLGFFNIKNQFKVCVHGLVTLIIRETAYRIETIKKV